jgi:hypothetical protein
VAHRPFGIGTHRQRNETEITFDQRDRGRVLITANVWSLNQQAAIPRRGEFVVRASRLHVQPGRPHHKQGARPGITVDDLE